MSLDLKTIVLCLAILTTGFMAGLFYTWSFSVVPGLKKLADKHYIAAFQSMNRGILNPAFFFIFLGSIVCLPLATILHYNSNKTFWYFLISSLLYGFGSIAVTFLGNIPLNNSIDVFDTSKSTPKEISFFRQLFESKWNTCNLIRTVTSVIAFALLIIGLLLY